MKVKFVTLLAGSALGAIALAAAAPADAKPKKHTSVRKQTVDPRDAKIRELEQKVDALTQRLDAQAAAQQAASQQVQAAQAAAAAAQAQATDALKQSQAADAQLKASLVKVTPSWKGGPQFEDKEAGFSFKPKGLIQWDAGYTGFPRGDELRGQILGIQPNGTQATAAGLDYRNLGWNSRARRLTIGADGTLPGGFRYSAEFNLAQGTVDYEDIYLAYDVHNSPITLQAGYFYPFSSLETMTSSKFTSYMERASFHDAFSYNRRLGVGFLANDKKKDSWVVQAGIFNEPINNGTFTHTGWQASLRGVYSPTFKNARLHLGANFQHRENTREAEGANYQSRPLTQLTDQRFISTGTIASKGDDIFGLELGGIYKSFHFATEAQKVWMRGTMSPAEIALRNAELDNNDIPSGTGYNGNPSFWAGYFEVGYYLTGESRGYKGGAWQRTKVLHPFNQGGWGAFQINGRIDYVNLSDRVGSAPAGTPDALSVASPFYVNGGKQTAYELSLIWNPVDYVRLMAQYGHLHVKGGPRASLDAVPDPLTTAQIGMFPFDTITIPTGRTYGVDTFGMRAQVDF